MVMLQEGDIRYSGTVHASRGCVACYFTYRRMAYHVLHKNGVLWGFTLRDRFGRRVTLFGLCRMLIWLNGRAYTTCKPEGCVWMVC